MSVGPCFVSGRDQRRQEATLRQRDWVSWHRDMFAVGAKGTSLSAHRNAKRKEDHNDH
jgi:hypothetical protein